MQYHIAKSLTTLNERIRRLLTLVVSGVVFLAGVLVQGDVIVVPEARSAYAPSAAYFDGRIVLGWRGTGSPDSSEDDQQLYLAFKSDSAWNAPLQLQAKSMFGPILAASRDQLFIAWHGAGNLFTGTGDPRLYLASLQRGGQIRYLGEVPGAKSAGPPGLALHQGRVLVGWRSIGNITVGMFPGNQHWINYRVFDPDSGRWEDADEKGINIVHANGTSGPTFTPVGERMYALWRGTGSITFYGPNSQPGDPFIYYGSFDGEQWSTTQLPLPTIPGALTAWSPGAVEWNGTLLVGWRGDQARGEIPGDPSLSFALFDQEDQWRSIEPFDEPRPGSAFAPTFVVDEREDSLWVYWRGVFNRTSGIDDQQIYAAKFPELP